MLTNTLLGFDEAAARPFVVVVVKRNLQLFAAYPDWKEREDLVGHVMDCARREWPKYDAARSAPQTWVTQLAHCRLIDLYRTLSLRRARETAIAARNTQGHRVSSGRHEPVDLADWLASVYRMAKRAALYPQRAATPTPPRVRAAGFRPVSMIRRQCEQQELSRRGRPAVFDRARKAALIALRVRLEMDAGELADLLAERPDLVRTLALRHAPTAASIAYAEAGFPRFNFTRATGGRPALKADFSTAEPLQALGLCPDEAGVLLLIAQRKSNQDIAGVLGVGLAEARRRVRVVLFKLDVLDRYAASLKALELLRPKPSPE